MRTTNIIKFYKDIRDGYNPLDKKEVNKIPNFKGIMNNYIQVLKKLEKDYKRPLRLGHFQTYTFTLNTARSEKECFDVELDIYKANDIIKEENIKPMELDVKYLLENECYFPEHVDIEYAKKVANSTEPIILIECSNIKQGLPIYVIDGTHRVHGRFLMGKENVMGYILSEEQWMRAFHTTLDEMLLKTFYNVDRMLCYKNGFMSEEQFKKSLYNINA